MLKELYHLRWGIETLFGVLKERLKIDNFTGKTVAAIKQDFFVIPLIPPGVGTGTCFVSDWHAVYINANC
jgi:hypothetical protein